ncbi:MAG: hypothetical protein RL077_2678 [Verrucomicrobiota bacterium]
MRTQPGGNPASGGLSDNARPVMAGGGWTRHGDKRGATLAEIRDRWWPEKKFTVLEIIEIVAVVAADESADAGIVRKLRVGGARAQ